MRKFLVSLVAVFSLAGVLTVTDNPVMGEAKSAEAASYSSSCWWWIYTVNGSSSYSYQNSAYNCAVNLGRRIFGTCFHWASVWSASDQGQFGWQIKSLSGGICGQSQTLTGLSGGYNN